ncbi:hypothetical protein L208DRAFT_472877 [Tricholoma matsutake]|nr:hypothetical protein L208DRAFT_472877 [Tricholoma matsutake 945]
MDPDNKFASFTHDGPSTKLWAPYISKAEKHSRDLALRWKGDMDSILIFAGLFSASLTGFIIESYKTLIPNNNNMTVVLLDRVAQHLAAMSSNVSISAPAAATIVTQDPFVPAASAVVCNTLWFLSLGFILTCALSATLVEQWTRNYLLATESQATPHERARVFEYLYKGLETFHMASVVEVIPLLLHISLFLFFVGLVEFLRPVNFVISMLMLAILLSCTMIYILATVMPVFQRNCPYCTPLSGWFWTVMRALRLLRRYDPESGRTVEICHQRDLEAMCWTLKALRGSTEFEPFIEVIPQVVAGFDYSEKLLLHKLLHYDDISVRLDHRISRLLLTCSGGLLEPFVGQKRATTCLTAIWSLTMMSITSSPSPPSSRTLCFDERTIQDMRLVSHAVPGVADYAISAMAVVARDVLDKYLECVAENEETLLAVNGVRDCVQDDVWHSEKFSQHHQIRPEYVPKFNVIHRRSQGWEKFLRPGVPISMPLFFILSCLDRDLTRLVSIAAAHAEDLMLAKETLKVLRDFRAMVNQSGFSLTVEYAAKLVNGRSPPYEAFNTIRRLFLTVDFAGPLSVVSQRRLVEVLDDVLEPNPKGEMSIPESIVNIMLGLTAAVKDQASAIKAINIISRNMKFFPSEDEAHKALSMLNNAIPRLTPTLDIFSSHTYANAKLDVSNIYND